MKKGTARMFYTLVQTICVGDISDMNEPNEIFKFFITFVKSLLGPVGTSKVMNG